MLGIVEPMETDNIPPAALKKSTRTVCGNCDVFAMVIWVTQPPPDATCGSNIAPVPPTPADICGNTKIIPVLTAVGTVAKDGTTAVDATAPVEVTRVLAVPVIGTVVIVGGNSVGGVVTPLNVGVTGANVVGGTVDVNVTPLNDVVTGVVTVTGTVTVDIAEVATTLFVFSCAATGNAVNVPPLKVRATTPIGTSELMNNNPVNA